MVGPLLVLAAFSDDLAERVIRYRPKVEELVRRVRADPEAFLVEWRTNEQGA